MELVLQNGLYRLTFSRRVLLRQIEDIPQDQWFHQAEGQANHVAWTLGHLAATDDLFLTLLSGSESGLPAGFKESFGTGSRPSPEPVEPGVEAIRHCFDERRQALRSWFEGLSGEELAQETPEHLRKFAINFADVMGSIAWHEGWHTGQISPIRKSLGLPSLFS